MNIGKSEKSAYFHHIFANNFFGCIFTKLFQRNRNQREILRFLIPILNFLIKNFFCSYQHFLYTLIANAQETAQKTENLFFMNVSQNCIRQPSKGLHNQVVIIVVPTVHASFSRGTRISIFTAQSWAFVAYSYFSVTVTKDSRYNIIRSW